MTEFVFFIIHNLIRSFLPPEELKDGIAWIIHTHISELDHAQFSQLTDAAVGCLWLEEELGQCHLLTPEQFPHDDKLTLPPLEQRSTAPGVEGNVK